MSEEGWEDESCSSEDIKSANSSILEWRLWTFGFRSLTDTDTKCLNGNRKAGVPGPLHRFHFPTVKVFLTAKATVKVNPFVLCKKNNYFSHLSLQKCLK